MMSFMLKAYEIPFLRLQLSDKKTIWAYLRFSVFSTKDTVIYFIIDQISLNASNFRRIEGKKLRKWSLNPWFYILYIDPKEKCETFFKNPR